MGETARRKRSGCVFKVGRDQRAPYLIARPAGRASAFKYLK